LKDVIVVGGGPAGAALAYRLAARGLSVLLLEKSSVPRFKSCAGGITRKAVRELNFDLSPLIEEEISRFIFTANLEHPVEAATREAAVYTVSREKFDAFLLMKAASAGAEVITGAAVRKIERQGRAFLVRADSGRYRGKIIAGADGARSMVARSFGLEGARIHGTTLECHLAPPPGKEGRFRGTIHVDYGLLRQGYAWLFPKGSSLSLGAGALPGSPGEIRSALKKLQEALELERAELLLPARGWLLPFQPALRRLHDGAVLLLGDAAGLVDPFTGEGIYNALRSARLAEKVIVEEIRRPSPNLRRYSDLVRKEMGPELAAAWRLVRLLSGRASLYHQLLQRHPQFAAGFLELLSGECGYPQFLRRCLKLLLSEGLYLPQRR
jgi:geranylgeranyl reductase family protein